MSKTKLKDHFYDPQPNMVRSHLIPDCDVLVNKQKRKVYGKKKNKIYLNDGDLIQINLFNPHYERIGVQLELNGTKEERMLVINPGQKILLDRFVDTKKKIKFSTYFVDGGDSRVKKAIEKNGSLKIHFWSEKRKYYGGYVVTGATGTSRSGKKLDFNKDYWFPSNGTDSTWSPVTPNNVNYISDIHLTSSNTNSRTYKQPMLEETGRIDKGEKSKQKMTEVDFECGEVFYTKSFKLLPFSKMKVKKKAQSKPKTVTLNSHLNYRNTDYRIYCSNPMCGYRVRNKNWKFCPICSTPIE